jgi:homoserine O-acetyltransferase
MGGAQTYQWATQYPDFMDMIIPFCSAARCAIHNKVFLEGQKSALLAVKGLQSFGAGGDGGERGEWSQEEKDVGMRAFGRGYAGWGFSQEFYRTKAYETKLGYKDLEDFLVGFWEAWATSKGKSLRS